MNTSIQAISILHTLFNEVYIDRPCNYSHDLGLRAAWLSSASYCDIQELSANGFQPVDEQGYELQAILEPGSIAFRGSSNIENWILDLDALKTDFKGTGVHKGFHKAW